MFSQPFVEEYPNTLTEMINNKNNEKIQQINSIVDIVRKLINGWVKIQPGDKVKIEECIQRPANSDENPKPVTTY